MIPFLGLPRPEKSPVHALSKVVPAPLRYPFVTLAIALFAAWVAVAPLAAQKVPIQLFGGLGGSSVGIAVGAGAGVYSPLGMYSIRVTGNLRRIIPFVESATDLGLLYGYRIGFPRSSRVSSLAASIGFATTVISRRGEFIDDGGIFGSARYEADVSREFGLPWEIRLSGDRGESVYVFGNVNAIRSYVGVLVAYTFE